MINSEQSAKLDQALASLKEFLPPLWAGLYKGLIEEGIPSPEATAMVCAYISTVYKNA